jgi:hypothetical protein
MKVLGFGLSKFKNGLYPRPMQINTFKEIAPFFHGKQGKQVYHCLLYFDAAEGKDEAILVVTTGPSILLFMHTNINILQ